MFSLVDVVDIGSPMMFFFWGGVFDFSDEDPLQVDSL